MAKTSLEVVAFVLGGGVGKRLYPLTKDRAKPALPFGGSYRVIDFVLSNLIHSRIRKIYVLTQYEPRSLEQHILEGWGSIFGTGRYNMIRLLSAKEGKGSGWYTGTANAINQNKRYAWESRPDIVNIFGGDHIYLMDISSMNDFHVLNNADLTVSAIPVKIELAAKKYGVLAVDSKWKLTNFQEKPEKPAPMPGNSDYCLASMGNYSFNLQVLIEELAIDHHKKTTPSKELISSDPEHYSSHDFGNDVIPAMLRRKRNIFIYNFNENTVTGASPNEKSYWRDIGDLGQFYEANMDLIGPNPSINLYNPRWEIFTRFESLQPVKLIGSSSNINNCLISNGCIIESCLITKSILSYNVRVGDGTEISDSLLLGNNIIGTRTIIRSSIIDRGIFIPDNTVIGLDRDHDLKRGFTVSKEGITVVPRKYRF
ncbi:MAG: glucose-1-phosphate adenylyltransferase [Actinobacteria bacterium]|nr:glucose-1-phosphate adenylyltransferase [Actinomycetota bacterium]